MSLLWSVCVLASLAQETPAELPPAAPMPSVDWTAEQQRLNSEDWKAVADKAARIANDPNMVGDHAGAWSTLGAALHRGGLGYAALTAWAEALERDTGSVGPFYDDLLSVTHEADEALWIGPLIEDDFSVPMSDTLRADVALTAARAAFDRGSWKRVLGLLPLVLPDDPKNLDATVLQSVTLAQMSRYSEALAGFLVAYERADQEGWSEHRRATLALNTARTFFASGNFGRAMEYYDKVPRSDPFWIQAHFERAWAHFRVEDMPGTVALLLTHQSPYFEDWFFPEADLLRAQTLFLMCKFVDTTEAIDAFQARYQPILDQLRSELGGLDEASAYDDALAFVQGKSTKIPPTLLRSLTWDERWTGTVDAIALGDKNLKSLSSASGDWADLASKVLTERLEERREDEGERVLDKAQEARAELETMLTDIELTRIDLLTFQADMYSRAAASGEEITYEKDPGRLRKLRKKGKQVWPFQGEYWADELGWFRVDARPECPENMRRGE